MRRTKQAFDYLISKHVLFIHSVLESGTASSVYGFGKGSILKKANQSFYEAADTFLCESLKQDIIAKGEQEMIMLYEESNTRILDALRYLKFQIKTETSVADANCNR